MTLTCPICSHLIEDETGICLVCADLKPAPLRTPEAPTSAPGMTASKDPASKDSASKDPASNDTRRDERFQLPTDVLVRKLADDGTVLKEERTVAHDLSRSGIRILTSWSDLGAGDRVSVQEVGGDFSSEAVVRHLTPGPDRITRVGLEFLERPAPDRLVGTTTSIPRPTFASSHASPAPKPPAKPEASPAPGSSPRDLLWTTTSIPRPQVTMTIPPSPAARVAASPPSPSPAPAPEPPPARPVSIEQVREEVQALCNSAQSLVTESNIWEALECLSRAQVVARGTSYERTVQILVWETQARVPSLMRTAQQGLEELVRAEPGEIEAHAAMGRIFLRAGLNARARMAFGRVLALDPLHRGAATALASLNPPAKEK